MNNLSYEYLNVSYEVESRYMIYENTKRKYFSQFNSRLSVKAKFDAETELFHFTINRNDVLLNKEPPEKSMDSINETLGETIYPLSIQVSRQGLIVEVSNHDEIIDRWSILKKELLFKYPSILIESYIKDTENNLFKKNKFIDALHYDSFFNLYFRDIYTPSEQDEGLLITWRNFPSGHLTHSYICNIGLREDHKITVGGELLKIVPDFNGQCSIIYTVGEKNEIHAIETEIKSAYKGQEYLKQISVKTDYLQVDYQKLHLN